MEQWKLGEDEDELFKKDDGINKSFSLGKIDKEDSSDFVFEENQSENQKKIAPKKESKIKSSKNYSKGKNGEIKDTQKTTINNDADNQDVMPVNSDKEENSQLLGIKGTDKNHKKVDIKV